MQEKIVKTKVNRTDDGFWVVPGFWKVFSPKSSESRIKKTKTLEDIIHYNDLDNKNVIFSFNGDNRFELFNKLQKIRNTNIYIDFNKVNKMKKEETLEFEVIDNLVLVIDFKTIKRIYEGKSFFFTKDYYIKFLEDTLLKKQSKTENTNTEQIQKIKAKFTMFGLEEI
ncbi:MPN499 family protein [Mycoplasma procyoni]|uniref:MPN499 family protein n=1 Tax=Mycoplasma procyoni TaxID=568784 RepID=UPI00197B7024|nr:hypothetical protein [Mycoplasma procyoni]MBN3534837.1 hypothetical protein [Mycoplasma procyoni]